MSSMRKIAPLFFMAAMMAEQGRSGEHYEQPEKKPPPAPPIPNGCKEYFFDHTGSFINHNDGIYAYKCVASNDRTAINKFEKWASKQFTT